MICNYWGIYPDLVELINKSPVFIDANMEQIESVVDRLSVLVGAENVLTDRLTIAPYGRDRTMDFHYEFDILIKPGTSEEVCKVLRFCSAEGISVTPRGGGSGVTGGALPLMRGVVLSTERLNKIIELNVTDNYVIVEAGVPTVELCTFLKQSGLHFPTPPSSLDFSFVGGNVAENSGSIYSCKYGSTGRYVLNLEVALPTGELIWTGSNVSKNVTGLDLTHLFVGSEGTLGIITKVVYRLLPLPTVRFTVLAGFDGADEACGAILSVGRSGLDPCVAELIGDRAISITQAFLADEMVLGRPFDYATHLLLEFDDLRGVSPEFFFDKITAVIPAISRVNSIYCHDDVSRSKLFEIRNNIGKAITSNGLKYRDIDVCVPRSRLSNFIVTVQRICDDHDIDVVIFGHALDGNLHTMLVIQAELEGADESLRLVTSRIYEYSIEIGGVITGEHGVGMLQAEYLAAQFPSHHLAVFQKIKTLFDPNSILNPGKMGFP